MHSSRMCTVRCSGHGGECLPGGGLPRGCVYLPGGVCPGGSVCPGAVHLLPLFVDRQTDTCKNITFLQLLLRTVKMVYT